MARLLGLWGAGPRTCCAFWSRTARRNRLLHGVHFEFSRLRSVVYTEIDCLTVVYDDVDLVIRWRTKESRLDEVALTASESLDLLLYWIDHHGHLSTSVLSGGPRWDFSGLAAFFPRGRPQRTADRSTSCAQRCGSRALSEMWGPVPHDRVAVV